MLIYICLEIIIANQSHHSHIGCNRNENVIFTNATSLSFSLVRKFHMLNVREIQFDRPVVKVAHPNEYSTRFIVILSPSTRTARYIFKEGIRCYFFPSIKRQPVCPPPFRSQFPGEGLMKNSGFAGFKAIHHSLCLFLGLIQLGKQTFNAVYNALLLGKWRERDFVVS